MFDKGFFGNLFDFNYDGKLDTFERAADFGAFMQLIDGVESSESRDLDSFALTEPDELSNALSDIGLDIFDFELMDNDEKAEVLEDAGLDPDDFDY